MVLNFSWAAAENFPGRVE